MAEPIEDKKADRSLLVTLSVALVCALLVSLAAVGLRPLYVANLENERAARLQSIVESIGDAGTPVSVSDLVAKVVELETGGYDDSIDAAVYDARKAALDPAESTVIPPQHDLAGIKRREKHAVVYLVEPAAGEIGTVILPIWGVGYQSAIYGYLALGDDLNEILGIKFYEHGETPGLGSRIEGADWQRLWRGKSAFDNDGEVSIRVGGSSSANRVDAISGATRTSMGVDGMVRFWLGDWGFGPFLRRLRTEATG